jgi:hypothetical protein
MRIAGLMVLIVAASSLAPAAMAANRTEADCRKFAMSLPSTPLFVAEGLICHTASDRSGPVEIIEAHGRQNFTYLRHLAGEEGASLKADDLEYRADRSGFFERTDLWGETVRHGAYATRAFAGFPERASAYGFECVAFSRYSGDGAEDGSFRHELFGLFCFDGGKNPAPMQEDLIEEFLKRLRLDF